MGLGFRETKMDRKWAPRWLEWHAPKSQGQGSTKKIVKYKNHSLWPVQRMVKISQTETLHPDSEGHWVPGKGT